MSGARPEPNLRTKKGREEARRMATIAGQVASKVPTNPVIGAAIGYGVKHLLDPVTEDTAKALNPLLPPSERENFDAAKSGSAKHQEQGQPSSEKKREKITRATAQQDKKQEAAAKTTSGKEPKYTQEEINAMRGRPTIRFTD